MENKLLIIGIDGFDPDLVLKWKDYLPNLKEIIEGGVFKRLRSVFPPDSIPAWVTIYTGLSPSQHGIIDSFDYLDKKKFKELKIDPVSYRGRTFWDVIGKEGKEVCIINPFLAYPAWEVNGIMVSGPVFEGGATTAHPVEFLNQYVIPPLGGLVDFPRKRDFKNFVKKTNSLTKELAEFGFRIYQDISPDLFFICFLTLDRIKHFLWRYCDPEDPTYPGKNEFSNVIKEFYFLLDSLIGRFRKIKKDNTTLLIISDHGHGRRCARVLNLNEFLRQEGYLFSNIKSQAISPLYFTEKLKVAVLNFLDRMDLQDLTFKLVKFIPRRKSLKKSSYIIDKEESFAYTSELCSTNPHGGIDINMNKLGGDGHRYKTICRKIIDQLLKIQDPCTGRHIVKWANLRDEIFSGEFVEKYPDVIFELDEDYGVNWSLFTKLVDNNPTHRKISGGHKNEGVFILDSKGLDTLPSANAEVHDFIKGMVLG